MLVVEVGWLMYAVGGWVDTGRGGIGGGYYVLDVRGLGPLYTD